MERESRLVEQEVICLTELSTPAPDVKEILFFGFPRLKSLEPLSSKELCLSPCLFCYSRALFLLYEYTFSAVGPAVRPPFFRTAFLLGRGFWIGFAKLRPYLSIRGIPYGEPASHQAYFKRGRGGTRFTEVL
jgi:hypothetical protein